MHTPPLAHLAAFAVRLALSAAVLMLAVGWVTPKNPRNTFGRAVLVSLVLSLATFVTLYHWAWIFWPIYAVVWLVVVAASYRVRFVQALLLALALSFLAWLAMLLFGIRTF